MNPKRSKSRDGGKMPCRQSRRATREHDGERFDKLDNRSEEGRQNGPPERMARRASSLFPSLTSLASRRLCVKIDASPRP